MSSQQSTSNPKIAKCRKIKILKSEFKNVRFNPLAEKRRLLKEQCEEIQNNPLLRNKFNCVPCEKAPGALKMQKLKFKNSLKQIKKNEDVSDDENDDNGEIDEKNRAVISELRKSIDSDDEKLRMMLLSNYTMNPKNVIPVFWDKLGKNAREAVNYDTLKIKYCEKNILVLKKDSDHKERFEKAEKSITSCGCSANEDGFFECNENCQCRKINLKMKAFQTKREGPLFGSYDKVFMDPTKNDYKAAFSCSEACACKGQCSNNVMLTVEQNVHKFEVFCDSMKGFCVKAMSFIPAGVPVLEYTGELIAAEMSNRRHTKYSMDIEGKAVALAMARDADTAPEGLHSSEFNKVYKTKWCVDAEKYGNEARFISHGCTPNLLQMNVFQNGFFPNNCRIVLYSTEDIYPGVELTLDYGKSYVNTFLKDLCLCNTFACRKNEAAKKLLARLPPKKVDILLKNHHSAMFQNWKKNIWDPNVREQEREAEQK